MIKQLNAREIEILRMVSQGDTYKHVARNLNLSLSMIKIYIRSSKDKLGVRTVCQAVARFVQEE